jgi:hypothetical protein
VPAHATLSVRLKANAPLGLTTVPTRTGFDNVIPEMVLNHNLAVSILLDGLVVPLVLKVKREMFAGAELLSELSAMAVEIIVASRVPGVTVAVFCVIVAV